MVPGIPTLALSKSGSRSKVTPSSQPVLQAPVCSFVALTILRFFPDCKGKVALFRETEAGGRLLLPPGILLPGHEMPVHIPDMPKPKPPRRIRGMDHAYKIRETIPVREGMLGDITHGVIPRPIPLDTDRLHPLLGRRGAGPKMVRQAAQHVHAGLPHRRPRGGFLPLEAGAFPFFGAPFPPFPAGAPPLRPAGFSPVRLGRSRHSGP